MPTMNNILKANSSSYDQAVQTLQEFARSGGLSGQSGRFSLADGGFAGAVWAAGGIDWAV